MLVMGGCEVVHSVVVFFFKSLYECIIDVGVCVVVIVDV